MVNSISLIGRFEHLPGRPKSDEARPLLEKIASQVKPIMTKRGWKVGTLAEFLPSNPSLLGLNQNGGQRINLRLRPPGNENTFYEYDQLVLVMLHELTHNVHGPHDAKFYKLLEEIEEEYYELKRKGYSGEGFHSEGNKVSGLKLNEYEGKAKGLAAAEKRLNQQRMIGKGGVLGGNKTQGKSMKELIIEATERRLKDDKSCAAGHGIEIENEIQEAQEQSIGVDAVDLENGVETDKEGINKPQLQSTNTSINPIRNIPKDEKIIDLTGDSDEEMDIQDTKVDVKPSIESTSTSQQPSRRQPIPSTSKTPNTNTKSAAKASPIPYPNPPARSIKSTTSTPTQIPKSDKWTCQTCTLINPLTKTTCEACDTPKPTNEIVGEGFKTHQGWYCGFCSSGPINMERWSCEVCGEVRKWG